MDGVCVCVEGVILISRVPPPPQPLFSLSTVHTKSLGRSYQRRRLRLMKIVLKRIDSAYTKRRINAKDADLGAGGGREAGDQGGGGFLPGLGN